MTKIEIGCYGDGGFGHQHTRERCADTVAHVAEQTNTPEPRHVTMSLRGEMPGDAWDEYEACDWLNAHAPLTSAVWDWRDGDFGLWTDESEDDATIRIELDSPNGPRVITPPCTSAEDTLAALPDGWTVHNDDWTNGVKLADGSWSYPLSEVDSECPDCGLTGYHASDCPAADRGEPIGPMSVWHVYLTSTVPETRICDVRAVDATEACRRAARDRNVLMSELRAVTD